MHASANAPAHHRVLKNAGRSPVTMRGSVSWFHSRPRRVCAANGAALEGPSTNALPGGPGGERAARPQPH